ncbi:cation diffusion facilitator family transporter [Paenibacillus sp. JSM ZJ436]|uniref:cation diffusion facilitator family transporter n=1 Tax=Paenibacillus sp. JSM ZJ436 TaxID=3376190 RepID=UPI0037ACEA6D
MNNVQVQRGSKAVSVAVACDFTLALVKGAAGMFLGSLALMADSLHTAAKGVTLWKTGVAEGARSKGNRAGKRMESYEVTMLLIPLVLITLALFMVYNRVGQLWSGRPEAPDSFTLIIVLAALLLNEAVFRYHAGRSRANSPLLQAHTRNHRAGIYSSLLVIAGAGLTLAGEYGEVPVLLYCDLAASLMVYALVIWRGLKLLREAIYKEDILVEALCEDHGMDYVETIQRVYGVITVEELKVQPLGSTQIQLEVKVSVNPLITVIEAHEIADRASRLLQQRFPQVTKIQMITAPYETGYPYKSNMDLNDNNLPTLPQ